MRIRKSFACALLAAATTLPLAVSAQNSSLNGYSPYTLYGLGNLNFTGSTSFSAMGGASIGYRNESFDLKVNTTNPASLSSLPQKTFFFDIGFTGSNVYLSQKDAAENNLLRKSSFNTFNISNVTVGLPLAKRLGLAVNVAPFSSIGYRIQKEETDEDIHADLGSVIYTYAGEGNITEGKIGVGWEPLKGLSLGAEFIYLWGNIDRTYNAYVIPYTGSGTYRSMSADTNEKVSRILGGFGVQYTPITKDKTRLTVGATYRLGSALNSNITDYIFPNDNIYGDTVRYTTHTSATHLPQTIGIGVYFHRPKYALAVDYVFQDWATNNEYDPVNNVGYTNTHTFKIGAQYTPERYDLRGKPSSFFRRITYRTGFRYNDYYLVFDGHKMSEKAVTFGIDVPFKTMGVSAINLGVEFGERGTLQHNLIRERYFKINVGLLLFGRDHDYWFEKYKYN